MNEVHDTEGEGELRGKLPYFGLALLLIGLVCVIVGQIGLRNVKDVEAGQSDELVWYYSCNLTSGNTYRVYIESNDAWGEAFRTGALNTPQPVNVTITSPGGGTTSLQAFFYSEPPTSPLYHEGTPATVVEVRYQNIDESGLGVASSPAEIRFMAKQNGVFTVRVLEEGLWSPEPPNFFIVYREVSQDREAYTVLASLGGVLSIIGGVTFIVSLFRRESVKHKKAGK